MIDFYHACEYIYKLAEALFSDAKRAGLGAKDVPLAEDETAGDQPRVALGGRDPTTADRDGEEAGAISQRLQLLAEADSVPGLLSVPKQPPSHRQRVTEAACKTVFTQRLKQSGMTWKLEGGQWIVDLRVIQLSGIWPEVYQAYLEAKTLPDRGLRGVSGRTSPKRSRNRWHWRDCTPEIKTIFESWQLAECLATARQTEPFDPDIYVDEGEEDIEMERQDDLRRSAADLLLVERAKEWLLEVGEG